MGRYRNIGEASVSAYGSAIEIRTYASGERRVAKDPPKDIAMRAFDELGTHSSVAEAFGVTRRVVGRWISTYNLVVVSRPELRLAEQMRARLAAPESQLRISQWLMDEGSVSVAYLASCNLTSLLVCGSMNDYRVLSEISSILGAPITSSRSPRPSVLPLGTVRVQSARAYALLEVLRHDLVGLKAMEATAALRLFPPSGVLRGRHTTDEFLTPVWEEFASESLRPWNSARIRQLPEEMLRTLAKTWVEGRVRRARRFVDHQDRSDIARGGRVAAVPEEALWP